MSVPISPSGETPPPSRPWALIGVVAVLLAVRLVIAGHIHLAEDEAYYRLWASAPALGYFDHPPMIAWWIWLGTHVAGDTPLGVRLLPIAGSAITSFMVWGLARQAGLAASTAQRAGVWWNATLLAGAGGILAVPDAPASLFWSLSLWAAIAAARRNSAAWWMGAGLAAGLACLSKYSALFLAPGILLWLVSTARGRKQLKGPGPWLAMMIAVAIFGLNVAWNAEHHWLTFAKQFGRVTTGGLAPRYLGEFVFGQAGLINPLLGVFLVRALARGDMRGRLAPFTFTSAPFFAYLLIHSLHAAVEAHWPAPLYPALAVAAAIGAERAEGGWRILRTAAPVLGFALIAIAMVWPVIPVSVPGSWRDPAAPLRGWPGFARDLETRKGPAGAAWVGAMSYGLTAELADEPELKGPVYELVDRDRYDGLAMGAAPDVGRPGLVVDLPRRIDPSRLRRCFANVRPLGHVERAGTDYVLFGVSGPRRDVLRQGC